MNYPPDTPLCPKLSGRLIQVAAAQKQQAADVIPLTQKPESMFHTPDSLPLGCWEKPATQLRSWFYRSVSPMEDSGMTVFIFSRPRWKAYLTTENDPSACAFRIALDSWLGCVLLPAPEMLEAFETCV